MTVYVSHKIAGIFGDTDSGYFDYNDTATAVTPIALTANVWTKLTNNSLGPNTTKKGAAVNLLDIWNTSTNQFDFTKTELYTMINIRVDVAVNSGSPNTEIQLRLNLGIGSSGPYTLFFNNTIVKSAGQYQLLIPCNIYIGNDITRNYPTEIQIKTDTNSSVIVNGWYCQIFTGSN